jgi:hypothetical protein
MGKCHPGYPQRKPACVIARYEQPWLELNWFVSYVAFTKSPGELLTLWARRDHHVSAYIMIYRSAPSALSISTYFFFTSRPFETLKFRLEERELKTEIGSNERLALVPA